MHQKGTLYHIFVNYNFYNIKFREFVLENFKQQDHIFVFRQKPSEKYVFNDEKTIYAPNFLKLFRLLPKFVTSKNIYIHYLPNGPSIIFWAFMSFLHKKIIWVFWGGDIYLYQSPKRTVFEKLYELCRKIVIKRIRYIAGFLPGDFDLIKQWYKTNAAFIPIIYPLPVKINNSIQKENQKKDYLQILIGNSADPSNNHIEALSLLKNFNKEPVRIICPLSYGGNKQYIEDVIREGTALFNDKFIPLTQFLPADKYNQILNDTDIAIMYHNRQQGLGNIMPLLTSNCKVFVKPQITTYSYFQNLEIKIFSTEDIVKSNYNDFIRFEIEWGKKNAEIIKDYFCDSTFIYLWSHALNL